MSAIQEVLEHFQNDLLDVKESLSGLDNKLSNLTGRDPSELNLRSFPNRSRDFRGRGRGFANSRRPDFGGGDGRNNRPGIFQRLGGPVSEGRRERFNRNREKREEDENTEKKSVSSSVVVAKNESESREEKLKEQTRTTDKKSRDRNKRMFGALMGTLNKFRTDEDKHKQQEQRQAEIERKLEEAAQKEKQKLQKEKQQLFYEREKKTQTIKRIQYKMLRVKEQGEWETKQMPLFNFIRTRENPHIFWMPKVMNDVTEKRLADSQTRVAKMIEDKRVALNEELEEVERRAQAREAAGAAVQEVECSAAEERMYDYAQDTEHRDTDTPAPALAIEPANGVSATVEDDAPTSPAREMSPVVESEVMETVTSPVTSVVEPVTSQTEDTAMELDIPFPSQPPPPGITGEEEDFQPIYD